MPATRASFPGRKNLLTAALVTLSLLVVGAKSASGRGADEGPRAKAASEPRAVGSSAPEAPSRPAAAQLPPTEPVAEATQAAQVAQGEREPARRSRVLVLGDSLVFAGFGTSLEAGLREKGSDVWLYGSCGASPVSFLRGTRSECGAVRFEPGKPAVRVSGPAPTPRLESLLSQVKPDAALLVLGTNVLCCSKDAAPDVSAMVEKLAQAKVPCLWVGVPSFRQPVSAAITRHYAMLEQAIGDRCTLLDARTLGVAFRDIGDNAHVDPVSGQAWAEKVVEAAGRI